MVLLRFKDITKMSEADRATRMKELKLELVKANVTAHRTNAKTQEIKRAIAKLLTYKKLSKSATGGAEKQK